MFISDFAIRRPIVTIVTRIALAVFGIAALTRLQTDEFPDVEAPIVFIGIAYPGASPDQVEIAGMIPVALGRGEGADFRSPLGRAVIGGTITSTVLTLFVIPTVYEILDNWRERARARFRRRTAHGRPHGTEGALPQPATGD